MSNLNVNSNNHSGFSLIELMVVISIVSLLAAFSHTKYLVFSAKARQVEAKQTLSVIYSLTMSHIEENPTWSFDTPFEPVFINGGLNGQPCGAQNPIGFVLTNCPSSRYYYGLEAPGDRTFTAYAHSRALAERPASEFLPIPAQPAQKGILPEWCNKYDRWSIDQNRVLIHMEDSIKDCLL